MKDVEIIGMLKSYVSKTLVGMGALKGASCQIQSITTTGTSHVITFEWKDSNNVSHTSELTLVDGANDVSELADVNITNVQDGQVFGWDAATSKWVNVDNSATVESLDNVGDVTITAVSNGQILTWDGTAEKWVNGSLQFSSLSDVNISNVQDKQVLSYDATTSKWVNSTPAASDIGDLGDVSITSAADNQALLYDSTDSEWKNETLSLNSLSDVDLTSIADGYILIYDATNNKWIVGANSGAAYTAGEGIEIDQNNKISSKIVLFTGTEAQWNALSLADKIKFTHYATNDDQTGQIDSVPTQNSLNLMTSGGIYNALQPKANTADLGTAAAKDSTNAVTQNSTDLVESGAVYTGLTELKEGEIYSTSETLTNKVWIDGKRIYRKVVDCGNFPEAGQTKSVAHGISNVDKFVLFGGYMYSINAGHFIPMPWPWENGETESYFVDSTYIHLLATGSRTSYGAIIVLEYTKS